MEKIKVPRKNAGESFLDYVDRIYTLNESRINTAFEESKSEADIKRSFRQQITDLMDPKYTHGKPATNVRQAILKELGRTTYTSYKERAGYNVIAGIKGFGMYSNFQMMLRDNKGHFVPVNVANFHYLGNQEYEYIDEYGNKVSISFKNSPMEINILQIARANV